MEQEEESQRSQKRSGDKGGISRLYGGGKPHQGRCVGIHLAMHTLAAQPHLSLHTVAGCVKNGDHNCVDNGDSAADSLFERGVGGRAGFPAKTGFDSCCDEPKLQTCLA